MSDTKDLIDILEFVKHAFCVGEEVEMFDEIKAIVEDYPKIKAMLNEFISQEVDEYAHMKHEEPEPVVRNRPDEYITRADIEKHGSIDSVTQPVDETECQLANHGILWYCEHYCKREEKCTVKPQPDKEYGGLIDALQAFVDSPDVGLRVSHIRDHLLMAIQALKWKGGKE